MTDLPDDLLLNVIQNQNALILHMVETLQAAKARIVELEARIKPGLPTGELWTDAFLSREGGTWIPWEPQRFNVAHAIRFKTSQGQEVVWDTHNGWRT